MSAAKGGKKKRRGKNINNNVQQMFNEPTAGQYFAKAIRPLGSFKVELQVYFYTIKVHNKGTKDERETIIFNTETKIGSVRGKMRRREYVNPGCIVLVSKREFSNDSNIVDIIYLYKPYHINFIKKHKYVPSEIAFSGLDGNDGVEFHFTDDEENSNEDDGELDLGYKSKSTNNYDKNSRKNDDYFSGMNLPNYNSEEEELDHRSTRKVDTFGNFIDDI